MCYEIIGKEQNTTPILISVPHSGTEFPEDLIKEFRPEVIQSPRDTDWFVHQVYSFAPDMGITLVKAKYSRYIVDLNRPLTKNKLYSDGRHETGIMPKEDFDGKSLYLDSDVDIREDFRISTYYHPYYDFVTNKLNQLKEQHGVALLFDAHSIRSVVSSIQRDPFPDLILGDVDETSAHSRLIETALSALKESKQFDVKHNHPFKGGNITRHFGKPNNGIHALQLEMSQRVYMDEISLELHKNIPLVDTLQAMFLRLIEDLKEISP